MTSALRLRHRLLPYLHTMNHLPSKTHPYVEYTYRTANLLLLESNAIHRRPVC